MRSFFAWFQTINWKQSITALKALLVAAGPTTIELAQQLGYYPSEVEKGIGMALSVIGVILLVMERTQRNMVLDAKGVKGTQVHIDTSQTSPAPATVKALARDPNISDVVPMRGGPRTDANKEGADE